MLTNEQFVRLSIELNVFFLRIIKEHIFFAAVSLPPKDAPLVAQLLAMKKNFEALLSRAVELSRGNISPEVMASGELITQYTLPAERAAEALTGVPIDSSITQREMTLGYRQDSADRQDVMNSISNLNRDIIASLNAAIASQTNLLKNILACKDFSFVYPSNLDHVTKEAQHYLSMLTKIQNKQDPDTTVRSLIEQEILWNDLMGEHAKFLRGYLDPSEAALFERANAFAREFDRLEAVTRTLTNQPNRIDEVTRESYALTTDLRNFKVQGLEGLLACRIRAIVPALFVDHITREANHYLRVLRSASKRDE